MGQEGEKQNMWKHRWAIKNRMAHVFWGAQRNFNIWKLILFYNLSIHH